MPSIKANTSSIEALLADPEVAKGLRDIAAFGGATTSGRTRISDETIGKIALLNAALTSENSVSTESERNAIYARRIHGTNLGGLVTSFTGFGASTLRDVLEKFTELNPESASLEGHTGELPAGFERVPDASSVSQGGA
jgi:hypothetical protein